MFKIGSIFWDVSKIGKSKFSKWRLAVLLKFGDKEISEIKMNSDQKNAKKLVQRY